MKLWIDFSVYAENSDMEGAFGFVYGHIQVNRLPSVGEAIDILQTHHLPMKIDGFTGTLKVTDVRAPQVSKTEGTWYSVVLRDVELVSTKDADLLFGFLEKEPGLVCFRYSDED